MQETRELLYEGGFFADFKYWVRFYDPVQKRSFITADPSLSKQKWEYYKQDPNGSYQSVYDDKKYTQYTGSSKEAKGYGCVSPISPMDLTIRDYFRGKSNQNCRIFYLDIETRVGTVMKGFPDPNKALEPVCLIQILDNITQEVTIIGTKPFYFSDYYLKLKEHQDKKVNYVQVSTEQEIFDYYFNMIENLQPAIQYAWNGSGFDFRYLYNRASRLGLNTARFSPFWRDFGGKNAEEIGLVQARSKPMLTGRASETLFDLLVGGCYYIDMMKLYQKIITFPRSSYRLDNIAHVELGTNKIDHSEFRTFDDFYLGNYELPENPTKLQKQTLCYKLATSGASQDEIRKAGHGQFIYYGIMDVVLLQGIDNKVGLTALMVSVTNKMNSQYPTILGTTKPWAAYIRNILWDRNQIITQNTILDRGADLDKPISGGFVREPIKGKHQWVLSADVNSMYPKLAIAGSNMSPDTFRFCWELSDTGPEKELKDFCVKHLHIGDREKEQQETNLLNLMQDKELSDKLKSLLQQTNLTMAPNGTFYRKDIDGVIPGLVKGIYTERKSVKQRMLEKERQQIHIQRILKDREVKNAS